MLARRWSASRRSDRSLGPPQAGQRAHPGLEDVAPEHRRHALRDHQQPLQAHPGVHVRLGQRLQAAVGMAPVAHRHVVPQLHPALIGGGTPLRRAVTGPGEQLGIGAARSGRAIRPPVVVRGQLDRHAQLVPGALRREIGAHLPVAAEHGGVQASPFGPKALGDQLAAPAQALRSVVVSQRPRAEHLEHGQVAFVADLAEIGRAQAALHAGQPPAPRMRQAVQVRGQRVHSRRGEQHRAVVGRHQRTARDHLVAAVGEEVEEGTGRLGHVHGAVLFVVTGPGEDRRQGRDSAGSATHRRTVPGRLGAGS